MTSYNLTMAYESDEREEPPQVADADVVHVHTVVFATISAAWIGLRDAYYASIDELERTFASP